MYWLTIGIFGTTAADPLFAVELTDFEFVRPNDGELKLTVVVFPVADVAALELILKEIVCFKVIHTAYTREQNTHPAADERLEFPKA